MERSDADRKRQRDHKRKIRDRVHAIKLERGCIDCGYKEHAVALQFDHRPGTIKVGQVAALLQRRGWDIVLAEIEKCDVRCANCHAVKTLERGQSSSIRRAAV